ncbi:MAG TPA: PilZ domain-containing protein, partial [Allosphingosinicella sp.]|nr:PilZ domain-containing protein [Allosphingosinicella sp.]
EVPGLDAGPDEADRDTLRPGAVTSGSIRQVCSVRKLSAGGAILHVDHEVAVGERLELELMNGVPLDGIVAWRNGSEVGLRFDAKVDVFALIAQDIVSQPGERRRMPRVEITWPALIETPDGTEYVTTRDVSQGGIKVDIPYKLEAETRVTVTLDGMHPVDGVVRWSQDNVAGIAFLPELRWQELMLWLKERRKSEFQALAPRREPTAPAAPTPEPVAGENGVQLNLAARVREGTRRWSIEVSSITTRSVAFDSFAALQMGSLLWVVLPGLEGWPARIVSVDGYRYTCEFTQSLHPAVLERILGLAKSA